jgi:hypothetical protein
MHALGKLGSDPRALVRLTRRGGSPGGDARRRLRPAHFAPLPLFDGSLRCPRWEPSKTGRLAKSRLRPANSASRRCKLDFIRRTRACFVQDWREKNSRQYLRGMVDVGMYGGDVTCPSGRSCVYEHISMPPCVRLWDAPGLV